MAPAPRPAGAERPTGREIINLLKAKKLPRMVDWFDPLVLGLVAVRTLISSTIGEYADQRPMQEAADGDRDMTVLTRRHDYSTIKDGKLLPPDADCDNPYFPKDEEIKKADDDDKILFESRRRRSLALDAKALWVDFIADLGDGFEATYTMAYLLARPELTVGSAIRRESPLTLPAGQILIFGGDLAYPNATEEEYRSRCLVPYDWAFPFTADLKDPDKREPKRELFFIAGNHDWYDGLAAFSKQFCYETTAVGGWRCRQQRSYFALKLPYRWWIWGVDVALGDSLDYAQRHYFDAMVTQQVNPGDKIIIILHAPDWQKQQYKALTMICELARQRGEVCAILAGDLHHYSRYESDTGDPKLQLITAGGGGAFAHPTHDQKRRINVRQEVAGTGSLERGAGARLRSLLALRVNQEREGQVPFTAGARRQFYPTKLRSRLLALKNIVLPLHNRRFAVFVGMVYMIFAWVFQIAVADPIYAIKNAQYVSIDMHCLSKYRDASAASDCSANGKSAFDKRLSEITALQEATPETRPAATTAKVEVDTGVGRLLDEIGRQGGWWRYLWRVLSVQFAPERVLSGMLASPAFFFLVAGLWIGLVQYADVGFASALLRWAAKLAIGTAHTAAHLTVLLATNSVLANVYDFFAASHNLIVKLSGIALYTSLMIIIGGTLGAFVFGIYWVVTSVLFGMHPDAFSALGIKNYKNFLRMKFEQHKLTIYPIALDKVPGRRGWKPCAFDAANPEGSLIAPKSTRRLKPRLIENPIEIKGPVTRSP